MALDRAVREADLSRHPATSVLTPIGSNRQREAEQRERERKEDREREREERERIRESA
jgi:hypothetical protein